MGLIAVLPLWAIVVCLSLSPGATDTPANCTFDDVRGEWIFYETERNGKIGIDCTDMGPAVHKKKVVLEYPNYAIDNYGNKGTWTMIYNEGFEVRVAGRSYFAFSYYNKTGDVVSTYCDATLNGWSRDLTIRNWACFRGRKVNSMPPKVHVQKTDLMEKQQMVYTNNNEFIEAINKAQSSWMATTYSQFEGKTLHTMQRIAGGRKLKQRVGSAKSSPLTKLRSMILPDFFDWRNVSGVNYVSPVRNQGDCGSCYAFASMAALEARVRILTRNEQQPVFSPQDILECSPLSQACDGGFAYLTAGRYAQDYGVVSEECSPYDPEHAKKFCSTKPSCLRHYTAYYRYVGGYYGACNEEEMKMALVKGGPLAIGIEVYNDFMQYQGGIYHHTGLMDKFNPLEETNHAVLLVGYGYEPTTKEPYWIVKNSWGPEWGEEGYVRIKRGSDEIAVESMAFEVVPIPS